MLSSEPVSLHLADDNILVLRVPPCPLNSGQVRRRWHIWDHIRVLSKIWKGYHSGNRIDDKAGLTQMRVAHVDLSFDRP